MMKRLSVSIFACVMVLLNLVVAGVAQAQPLTAISLPGLQNFVPTEQQKELLTQLEAEVLPQIDTILSPAQQEQFKTAIADGTSFRKAFKSLALTSDQKAKLGALLKTLPKKDIFASLTPEQKKQFFTKKKEMFMPTPEEIGEKISEKMKLAKDKAGSLMPSPETISDKVTEKIKMGKSKVAE
jgi:Spy/CpxP family protein refolding chaperone